MDTTRTQAEPGTLPDRLRRLLTVDRLLLALALLGLLSSGILGNPARTPRPWPADSILQHVVWIVSLGYAFPTMHGPEIKSLMVSLVSAALLIWASVRVLRGRLRLVQDLSEVPGAVDRRVGAATLSMFAVLLLLVWSLLSCLWSDQRFVGLGATWVMALGWLWAAGLALHGHRRLVRPLTDMMLIAASMTAALSLWYWQERATGTRLGWPQGNPLLLGSIMVPTVLLAAGRLAEQLRRRSLMPAAAYAAVAVLALVTLRATGSRGPFLALMVGAAAGLWIWLPRRGRVVFGLAGLVGLAMLAPSGADWLFRAGGGRDASARMRLYAWRDALQMAWQKPAAGYGAGAFNRMSTGMSALDRVIDPLAMSGDVSSDPHCEPLELLADLGAFGAVVGLAIWGFAGAAAAGRAEGPDRILAAAIVGALVAAFTDTAGGVSWRLEGPAPFVAMPVALAWMLWREPPAAASAPGRRWGVGWVPAVAGVAAALAAMAAFHASWCLYRGEESLRQAENLLFARTQDRPADPQALKHQVAELLADAMRQIDRAGRLQMDPTRWQVAQLARGRIRGSLAYLPFAQLGQQPAAYTQAQQTLDEGIAILRRLLAACPGYADGLWRIAELYQAKITLAPQGADNGPLRHWQEQSLAAALQHLSTAPLDRRRAQAALDIFPQIPPAQRLLLLRGALREEIEVWRQGKSPDPAYQRWLNQMNYLTRQWQLLGPQADRAAEAFLEAGYAALRLPYRQWPDPLAPEAVRLTALWQVAQGEPARAAESLELANLLYERTGGLLPYSQAALYLDLAACRTRQGIDHASTALAALTEARRLLRPLPDNPIHQELLEVAEAMQHDIEAAGNGGGAGTR